MGRGTYIPTTPLSYTRAISYVRGGGSVFADSRNNAYKLAKAVGGMKADDTLTRADTAKIIYKMMK